MWVTTLYVTIPDRMSDFTAFTCSITFLLTFIPSTKASTASIGCNVRGFKINDAQPLELTRSISSSDCFRRCTEHPLCNSANFHETDRSCYLSDITNVSTPNKLVSAPGFTHVSIHSCTPEVFWSQCDFSDNCGGNIMFTKYQNYCLHAYDVYMAGFVRMESRCRSLGSYPAKLEDYGIFDHVMKWMGARRAVGRRNWGFSGARRTSCTGGWHWSSDLSSVTWHNVSLKPSSKCFDAMLVSNWGSNPGYLTSPNMMICQRLC